LAQQARQKRAAGKASNRCRGIGAAPFALAILHGVHLIQGKIDCLDLLFFPLIEQGIELGEAGLLRLLLKFGILFGKFLPAIVEAPQALKDILTQGEEFFFQQIQFLCGHNSPPFCVSSRHGDHFLLVYSRRGAISQSYFPGQRPGKAYGKN
jgi:hypothetical protein